MQFNLPKNVLFILNTLENNRHKAYIVGGCVRDLLMGKTPHDFDITTSALPNQIKSYFEHTADTGIKHGTVTVIIDNQNFEVTTFRTESGYDNFRSPQNVEFVSDVEDDLSRRDFTVNAICLDKDGNLIDKFGGIEDIKNRTLKAVGNADERFFEDALRIMRLFRFSATLGFEIESDTKAAALKHITLLKKISVERIFEELQKSLLGTNLNPVFELINSGALSFLGIEKCKGNEKIKNLRSENLHLYAFLKDCNCDSSVLKQLKASNATINYFNAIDSINLIASSSKADVKYVLKHYNFDIISDYIEYKFIIQNNDYTNLFKFLFEIKSNKEPYTISHLNIDGDDLKALGFEGEKIGKILNLLLDLVIENPEKNEKNILIDMAKKLS